jgi:hypothetical protein
MRFFNKFPYTPYVFGDDEDIGGKVVTSVFMQDISLYVDVIDQIKDNISFYQEYYIQENERPDQLSQKIYGAPHYHWTFFMMNDKLRERGWPLNSDKLFEMAKRDFPNQGFVTRIDMTNKFLPGQVAVGSQSGGRGIILRRHLDLGLVIVSSARSFKAGEIISTAAIADQTPYAARAESTMLEYNAPHHYEDGAGNYVDIDPYQGPGAQLVEITNYDRYVRKNEELREIIVIKPEAIREITSLFEQAIS